jgi:hypothetical protein
VRETRTHPRAAIFTPEPHVLDASLTSIQIGPGNWTVRLARCSPRDEGSPQQLSIAAKRIPGRGSPAQKMPIIAL